MERRAQCTKIQYNEILFYFLRIPDVLTCFFFISLLFISHLLYNMYIFACMNMYLLLDPYFMHNLVRNQSNIDMVNQV